MTQHTRRTRITRIGRLGATAALIASALTLAACTSSGGDSASGGDADKPKVAFACATAAANPFFSPMIEGAENAAAETGVDLTYTGLGSDVTGPALARIATAALNSDPDVLIVCNFFPDALDPIIKQAVAQGTPVFVVNSGLAEGADAGAIAGIGSDDFAAAQQAGVRLVEAGAKHPLCVNHLPTNPAAAARCDGAAEAFEAKGLKLDVFNLSPDQYANITAYEAAVKGALAADSTIDCVLALGPQQGPAAVRAVAEAGRTGSVTVATFDVSDEIAANVESGDLLFAVWQQPYLQGYLAVSTAAEYARHGFVPSGQLLTGPAFVTKDTVDVLKKALEDGLG